MVTTATMGKNNELTAEQRGAIFYLRKNGNSYNQIAETVRCGKTTVYDTLKRQAETGSIDSKPRPR